MATVRAVHSGFASPASGKFHAELKKEFTERIEKLLAEKTTAAVTATTPEPEALVADARCSAGSW